MAGRPPPPSSSSAPPVPPAAPSAAFVYPFATAPPLRYKPPELPPQPFVPQLTYMEGQFATHALLIEQQRRIKTLEAELASTQMELMRLRATHNPLVDSSHPSPPPAAAPHQHSHDDAKKTSSRYWTADEHNRFLEGLRLFGQKDIKAIARHVGTRNATQVRTHAQKYYLRIERERAKAANDHKNSQKPSSSKLNGPIAKSEPMEEPTPSSAPNNSSNSHSNSLNNSASSTPNIGSHPNPVISHSQVSPTHSAKQPSPNASTPAVTTASSLQLSSDPLPPSNSGHPQTRVSAKQSSPSSPPTIQSATTQAPKLHTAALSEKLASSTKAIPSRSPKRPPPSALRRSPRKRAKPSASKQSPTATVPNPGTQTQSTSTPPQPPSSSTSPPDSDSQKDKSVKPESVIVTLKSQTHTQIPSSDQKTSTINESGGSISNLRTWIRAVAGDETGPSASKPPALRRNGSSNSVLAELSKNPGALSRSNSFVMQTGKGVTRSNSILSLLSGIPTVMRESPSTDRLLGLDTSDDKVLAALKAVDAAGNAAVAAGQTMTANNSLGTMGDRTFSFSQLNHMSFDDLEDTGAVALAIQDDQKWGDA